MCCNHFQIRQFSLFVKLWFGSLQKPKYQLISDANYYWLHITQPMAAAAAVSVSAGEESRIDDALNASLTLALQEKN